MPTTDSAPVKQAGQRVLLHAFSTFKTGGPQVRFVQLANSYGPRFKHLVTAMDGCYDACERFDAGTHWAKLEVPVQRGGALANRSVFRQVLRSVQPDLLLTYNWGAIEWIAGNIPNTVPQVHVEDGFRPDEVHGQLPRRVWTRRVLFTASGVRLLVPSKRLHDIAPTWWIPPQRLAFVPNGVDIPPDCTAKEAPAAGSRPLVVGTVAALRAEKNLPRLLRAVARLRSLHELRLLIVGDGPEKPGLEALARELGIADITEFTGHMAQPSAAFRRMDLFALSSDTEQLPIAMLEAMAHALPVVATAVGDVPHVLPPQAASMLAEPDDAAFQATLARALQHRQNWRELAAAGQALVRQSYARERMQADWLTVFNGAWPEAHGA